MSVYAQKVQNQNECSPIASTQEIIEDVRAGKPVIMIDDESRENEGDLIVAAEKATPEIINFMAREGRGLICLPMRQDMIERLGLELMGKGNNSSHKTAFTVSIEAKEGVTTGISAADRAQTIKVAIDPKSTANDIATPGHIFPLKAREGGVLVRAGHTEAAVDLSALAGFSGAGVICEVMNDDGTMARLPELVTYAKKHDLKIGTIADLIAYRAQSETLVERTDEQEISIPCAGTFTLKRYKSKVNGHDHAVLVHGNPSQSNQPVPVRMHSLDFKADILHCGDRILHAALKKIVSTGSGIAVILIPENIMGTVFKEKPEIPESAAPLRQIGIGAQILKSEGLKKISLLTNAPKPIIGLEGYGLEIISFQEIYEERP